MKELLGSIPWSNKLRIFATVLLCVIVLGGICVWYSHYLSGPIMLDGELLNALAAIPIDERWEKLLPLGFHVFEAQNTTRDNVVLTCEKPEAERNWSLEFVQIRIGSPSSFPFPHPGFDPLKLYIDSRPAVSNSQPGVIAGYRRDSISDVMLQLGDFGYCESWAEIELPHCTIYMADYDASGDASQFDAVLQTILDVIE